MEGRVGKFFYLIVVGYTIVIDARSEERGEFSLKGTHCAKVDFDL